MSMPMPSRNKRKERSSPEPQTQPPSEITASSSSAADNLSSPPMEPHLLVLPPGYKFVPKEEELLRYLKSYLDDGINSLLYVPIHHVNIYDSNPQQLSVEFKKGNETEWFFISERNKVAAKNGKKHKRGDIGGFWHATTKTTSIDAGEGIVGNETALAYYVGKPSSGVKSRWLMHEYWFDQPSKDYALCKIYVSPQVLKKEKAEEEEKQKRKKEEEAVATAHAEALEEQQPSNVEYHQALVDSYQPDQSQSSQFLVDSYQPDQSQSSQSLVDSYQPYQSQSSQSLMDSYQPDQSQFSQALVDSYQPYQSQFSQSLVDSYQPGQPQSSQSVVDSYQQQPRDFEYQQYQQFWSNLLGSCQPQDPYSAYQEQQSTMILHPPPQCQDSRSEMVMTMQSNPDWLSIYNDFDIDEYLRMDLNMIRQKR